MNASSTKGHESDTKSLVRVSRSSAPLLLYSLCTSIPSAPLLLQSSVHERARIRHERPHDNGNFYTLLINIGSIVPGAPAALGIGAASFDGEGGDVDGKDTAESPTA